MSMKIGHVDIRDLAKAYGTPTYVYDEPRIRENYRRLHGAFKKHWEKFKIYYAVKCNSHPEIIRILKEEGAGADCASANEILLVRRLGFTGDEILFSGNNLSKEDFEIGWKEGVFFNLDDLSLFSSLLKMGVPERLSFRINPGIGKSNVHESDVMAGPKAKFGIPFERIEEAYRTAQKAGVRHFGVHMMTGSCVTDAGYFEEITEKLLKMVGPVFKKLGLSLEYIDIGGGFGIPYLPNEKSLDIEQVAKKVVAVLSKKSKEYSLGEPILMVEPGRYLVGDAGWVIGTVTARKESYATFVGTDVGMNILARPMIYDAYHHIYAVKHSKLNLFSPGEEVVNICGQCCENADAWAIGRKLPKLEVGDYIVVENAGAYGYVMSFPYNGRLRAAEVLVKNSEHRLIRRRETLDDWLSTVVREQGVQK